MAITSAEPQDGTVFNDFGESPSIMPCSANEILAVAQVRAQHTTSVLNVAVVVSALGYFVDIYDLVLFSIVRVQSLRDLGVSESALLEQGVFLLNMQMGGMLIGGILWGMLGDKRGRISVLFGSILLYSVANILNAFVPNVEMYALLRFIAGIGLAGELGAAVTIVSEIMSKETRGYGTALVAGVGVTGAVFAAIVGRNFSWQTAYIVGGVLGLLLLATRMRMKESSLFSGLGRHVTSRGNFLLLFAEKERFIRYLSCILIGVPIWFVVGILITFSPEICRELGAMAEVSAGTAIMWCYIGLIGGDLSSGVLSQIFKSRKLILTSYLSALTLLVILFVQAPVGMSPNYFYTLSVLLGWAAGYWAVFVTTAAEQFGTNIRATVTTTVPNFVRGAVVVLTLAVNYLKAPLGLVPAVTAVGIVTVTIAFLALATMNDSYDRDLDFVE